MDKFVSCVPVDENILFMNEITCKKCGWNWLRLDEQSESDCPFCPEEPWGFVFIAP